MRHCIVHLVLALAIIILAAVLTRSQVMPREDVLLRALMGTHVFHSTYTFSKDEPHALLLTLEFEDGQLKRRSAPCLIGLYVTRPGPANFQFLWNKQGQTVWCFAPDSFFASSFSYNTVLNPFWAKVEAMQLVSQQPFSYEGYTILGFATSLDPDNALLNSSDLSVELKNKKYIGAVALKTFKTSEEVAAFDAEVQKEIHEREKQEQATALRALRIELTLFNDGKMELNEKELTQEQLLEELTKLHKSSPKASVTIKLGDDGMIPSDASSAIEACHTAGFKSNAICLVLDSRHIRVNLGPVPLPPAKH